MSPVLEEEEHYIELQNHYENLDPLDESSNNNHANQKFSKQPNQSSTASPVDPVQSTSADQAHIQPYTDDRDFNPEETYVTPDTTIPIPDDIPPGGAGGSLATPLEDIQDPEVKLIAAIRDRKEEEVRKILENGFDPQLLLRDIPTYQLISASDETSVEEGQSMTYLDYAVHIGSPNILNILIDFGYEKEPGFDEILKRKEFLYTADVYSALVGRENILDDCFDACVQSTQNKNQISLNLKLFLGLTPSSQTALLKKLSETAELNLLRHPVTQTFVALKWKSLRKFLWLQIIPSLLFSVVFTISSIADINHFNSKYLDENLDITAYSVTVFSVVSYLPLLLQIISEISASWSRTQLKPNRLDFNHFVNILLFIFLLLCLCTNIDGARLPHLHFSGVVVFLSWLNVTNRLADFPTNYVFFKMFQLCTMDVLKFFAMLAPLLTGFVFSFHIFVGGGRSPFSNPVDAILKTFSMGMREFNYNQHFSTNKVENQVSTQIIYLGFLLVFSLGMMNMVTGLVVSNIREIRDTAQERKFLKRLDNCVKLQESVGFFNKIFRLKFPVPFPPQLVRLRQKKDNGSLANILKNRLNRVENTADILDTAGENTGVTVADSVFQNSLLILQMRAIAEKEKQEIELAQCEQEDYSSLYWREEPPQENEYEQVQPQDPGIHNMKESLLKELKKDISRFLRGDNIYTKPNKRSGKTVNVRPGLALGVITLQAGRGGLEQIYVPAQT